MRDKKTCAVCGEEHGLEDMECVEIKGENKDVCKGCITAIKGLA